MKQDPATPARITAAIRQLLAGDLPHEIDCSGSESDEMEQLCESMNRLIRTFAEARPFLLALSEGRLEVDAPPGNFLVSHFKQLHANLRHLTRQMQRITQGDLNQQDDLLGELSTSFNAMTASLSRKKATEEALHESESPFRSLFEAMTEGVALHEMVFDGHGAAMDYRVITVNPAYETHTGLSAEKASGALASSLYGTRPPYLDEYAEVVRTGQPHSFETYFPPLRKHFHIKVFSHSKGKFITVFEDITARKKMEEERLKGRMLESIGYLAGGIAHDYNNLLTVILGNISLAKLRLRPDDKAYRQLDDAEKICEMASGLSNRLITFATGGDSFREVMPLSGVITDAIDSVMKGSGIRLDVYLPENLYEVAVDEGQMKQAIANLVSNAKEAMPRGGTFTVRGFNLGVSARDSVPLREGRYLLISFRDTGPGIPENDLVKIFDPYYSTKTIYSNKGLGLGLAVSYSMVKKNDGLLTVESEVGKGTTFHIYLPAADKS